MNSKFLRDVEEKYVFNISQILWHVFIGLATLGIVVGIFYFLWGIIPASKDEVEKKSYPPVNQVTVEELKPVKQTTTQTKPTSRQESVAEAIDLGEDTTGYNQYYKSYMELQKLIPPSKYSWASRGRWEYPYGQRYYERYKNTTYGGRYRNWVVDQKGIDESLNNIYSATYTISHLEKKKLVDAYNQFLTKLPEEKRISALRVLFDMKNESLSKTVNNVKYLEEAVRVSGLDDLIYLKTLVAFLNYNPMEGSDFVKYVNSIISEFKKNNRYDALKALIDNYYKYYNNNLRQQKEATDIYVKEILPYFIGDEQVTLLDNYYSLNIQKNKQRQYQINQIEAEYQQALAKAEANYQADIIKKSEYRLEGIYAIISGIFLVAFIALLLVLLSIQRYLKGIEQKLGARA